MPSLQEVYHEIVEHLGPESKAAKAVKQQIEAKAYSKGQSAERFFIAGGAGKQQTPKGGRPAR